MSAMLPDGWVISTYAAVHARDAGGVGGGLELLEAVAAWPECSGIELPIDTTGPRYSALDVLRRTPAHSTFVLTTLPLTMDRRARNPAYGLASRDRSVRRRAVQDLTPAIACARALHAAGHTTAIHVYSAPGGDYAALGALARSLSELARLAPEIPFMLEHCDSHRAAGAAQKGFLPLRDETAAVIASGTNTRITVNWARSAIDARGPHGPAEHVSLLSSQGMLGGFVLSGCSDRATAWGPAWCDEHLPTSIRIDGDGSAPAGDTTLLTQHAVGRAIEAMTSPPVFVGLKLARPRQEEPMAPLLLGGFLRQQLVTLTSWFTDERVLIHRKPPRNKQPQ